MYKGLTCKTVAASVCLGFCVVAQAHAPPSGQEALPRETRLPGEPPLPFMAKWGTNGTVTGEFSFPKDVAIDAAGNVYVADGGSNQRIQKFDNNGTFLGTWGSSGSGEGEFWGPVGLAIDASGNIYVSDSNRYRVQKFDSAGNFLEMWGWGVATGASAFEICTSGCQTGLDGGGDGQFSYPGDIAFDLAGNVYVADSSNHRIQKFDSSGNFLRTWGWGVATGASAFEVCTGGCQAGLLGNDDGQFAYCDGVAVDNWGTVYVADTLNHRLQKFDTSGAYLGKMADPGSLGYVLISTPYRVVVDHTGNLYVDDYGNDQIWKFDRYGTFLTKWGSTGTGDGQFDMPVGVAVDASGNLFTTEIGNHRVQKFGPAFDMPVFIKEWGTSGSGDSQFIGPRGPAVDSSGNVYVADRANQRIQKYDANGALLFMFGWGVDNGAAAFQTCTDNCQAGSSGGGTGQFNSPTDLALDGSGNIYVADSLNYRIQKFDSTGAFLRTWGWGVDDGSSAFQNCTSGCQAGSSGSGDGQLNDAERIDVSAAGNVYVADMSNHRIQEFDSSGNFVRTFGWGVDDGSSALQVCTSGCQAGTSGSGDGQFSSPEEVAVDASGNIYVTDDNERVQKFSSSAGFLAKWGSPCDVGTSGIDACDGDFNYPYGLEVDASGNVFVADTSNHRIQKFDNTGTFGIRWGVNGSGESEFNYPCGVAIDSSGNIYVADTNNHRIQQFGPCGFDMSPLVSHFTSGAGGGSFSLDAVSEFCGWTATASQSWITVTGDSGGFGDETVNFSVAANPTALVRGGTIAISDETTGGLGVAFTIIQDPAPCTYGLTPGSTSFSGGAGADFVSVTSLLGCAWTAVSNDGWISVDAGAAGNGDGVVLYSVTANPGSAARSGTMTIAGHTFTVNQDPQIPDAPSNLACAARGSTKVDLTWEDNATNEAWIRIERKLGAAGTYVRVLTVPADTTGALDREVKRATTYVYRVKACNSAGCSAPSNEFTETTPSLGVFIGEEEARRR